MKLASFFYDVFGLDFQRFKIVFWYQLGFVFLSFQPKRGLVGRIERQSLEKAEGAISVAPFFAKNCQNAGQGGALEANI